MATTYNVPNNSLASKPLGYELDRGTSNRIKLDEALRNVDRYNGLIQNVGGTEPSFVHGLDGRPTHNPAAFQPGDVQHTDPQQQDLGMLMAMLQLLGIMQPPQPGPGSGMTTEQIGALLTQGLQGDDEQRFPEPVAE